MTFAIDLRLMSLMLALVAFTAGCNTALTHDDAAPRPSAAPTRSQPAPSASSGASSNASRTGSGASAPVPIPAPQPDPPPPPTALQIQLADAIRLFDAGEFYAAAGRLRNLPDLNTANVETQLTAMKYLAFSYCVTNRRTLCQQQFEAALRVDPKFELAPAERGHPIWKVHFERAKQAVAAASAEKASAATTKPADAKTAGAKKVRTKKVEAKSGAANTNAAPARAANTSPSTGAANTGATSPVVAKTGKAKRSASASKSSRKEVKADPKSTAAAPVDSRPSPDQRPQ